MAARSLAPWMADADDPWAPPAPDPGADTARTVESLRREVAAARAEAAAVRADLERESEVRRRLAEQVEALAAHVGFALPDLPMFLSPPRPPANMLPDDVSPF